VLTKEASQVNGLRRDCLLREIGKTVPSFPQPAWQFGPAIKLCSMEKKKEREREIGKTGSLNGEK
jgi:hypothetical protein